jgi:hypothetical protein
LTLLYSHPDPDSESRFTEPFEALYRILTLVSFFLNVEGGILPCIDKILHRYHLFKFNIDNWKPILDD